MFLRKLNPFVSETPDMDASLSEPLLRQHSSTSGTKSSRASLGSSRLSINTSKSRWQPVTKFDSPIFQSGTLPGPLYYLKVRKPGREIPMAVQLLLPHQGHTLITDKRGNYFRLQLNYLHCVEAVTCLSKKPFCSEIFAQLYGKHEAFFDKLLTRFKEKKIDDFYAYFTKPFMSILYQESFTDLLNELRVYDVMKTKYFEFHKEEELPAKCCSPNCPVVLRPCHRKVKECGQSAALRQEAAAFWKVVGGENIVLSHIARYLIDHSVTNPHYALPKEEDELTTT